MLGADENVFRVKAFGLLNKKGGYFDNIERSFPISYIGSLLLRNLDCRLNANDPNGDAPSSFQNIG